MANEDLGASASRPGSREPSPDGLGPLGFDPSRVIADLVTDLAKFDWEITCEGCGAPLLEGDDFVSDEDGASGCWNAMTDLPSKRARPCYAYRVGGRGASEPCDCGGCLECDARDYRETTAKETGRVD